MIDLVNILKTICQRNRDALEYIPEYWLLAELYADLKKQASSTGWMRFPLEMPYVTVFPTVDPKMKMRDGATGGGLKVADLCLWNEKDNSWHWLELKAGVYRRQEGFSNYYFKAFCKDLRALRGFTVDDTADAWEHKDTSIERFIEKYKFRYLQLETHASQLKTGVHRFTGAYLQVGIELDPMIWDKKQLFDRIQSWNSNTQSQYAQHILEALPDIDLLHRQIDRNIWLVFAQWSR
jgi:hypothetical protein